LAARCFLGKFAAPGRQLGGEFYAPLGRLADGRDAGAVRRARVFDPACSSGGIFVRRRGSSGGTTGSAMTSPCSGRTEPTRGASRMDLARGIGANRQVGRRSLATGPNATSSSPTRRSGWRVGRRAMRDAHAVLARGPSLSQLRLDRACHRPARQWAP
jgi:hypothetical protein